MLRRMVVSDFRCLPSAEVELDPELTLIAGPNASGKTSLLEAIHVLGRGRSFRTRRLEHLIRRGAERFLIVGAADLPGRLASVGVEGSPQGMRAKLAGERVKSRAELAAVVPVQIIDPEVHRLIEEGPARRRRYLDWGVFHVEPGFVRSWQRYQQILDQRNAALKLRQPRDMVAAWDGELVSLGEAIHRARSRYVSVLSPVAATVSKNLMGKEVTLGYRSGWLRDTDLGDALAKSWPHDLMMGTTQVGPQRAELTLLLDGVPVKDRISRGQQKLLAAALLIAQLDLFVEGSVRPTLLLDDPAAELDADRLLGLLREVKGRAVQLVVTSLSPTFDAFGTPGRRYRIEAGQMSPA